MHAEAQGHAQGGRPILDSAVASKENRKLYREAREAMEAMGWGLEVFVDERAFLAGLYRGRVHLKHI